MRYPRYLPGIAAPLLAAVLLGGCGAATAAGLAKADSPTYRLTVARNGAGQHLPPLRRVVTDKAAVLSLYRDMYAVKPAPKPFTYMCPMDLGVSYALTFEIGGKRTRATVQGSGCQFIQLGDGKRLWPSGKSGQAFWAEMGRILRMTRTQLRG